MQTLLYVSRMERGDETAVRAAHERFPLAALDAGIGVERIVAFIGSGMYALEITVADGDVQENLHRFLDHPDVQRLFDELRPHVATLPLPGAQTADLPLATAMILWQAPGHVDATSV
jgi:hypothetical protein